jgi:hypothetical protein
MYQGVMSKFLSAFRQETKKIMNATRVREAGCTQARTRLHVGFTVPRGYTGKVSRKTSHIN